MASLMQVKLAGIVLLLAAYSTAALGRMSILTGLAAAGAINAAEVLIIQARRYRRERVEQRLEHVDHDVDAARIARRLARLAA